MAESGKGSFTPYPKSEGGSKGKGQSTKSFSPKQSFYDQPGKGSKGGIGAEENGALFDARKRLVERASRNNGTGLIQRPCGRCEKRQNPWVKKTKT